MAVAVTPRHPCSQRQSQLATLDAQIEQLQAKLDAVTAQIEELSKGREETVREWSSPAPPLAAHTPPPAPPLLTAATLQAERTAMLAELADLEAKNAEMDAELERQRMNDPEALKELGAWVGEGGGGACGS